MRRHLSWAKLELEYMLKRTFDAYTRPDSQVALIVGTLQLRLPRNSLCRISDSQAAKHQAEQRQKKEQNSHEEGALVGNNTNSAEIIGVTNVTQYTQYNVVASDFDSLTSNLRNSNCVISTLEYCLSTVFQSRNSVYITTNETSSFLRSSTSLLYLCTRAAACMQDIYLHFLVQGHDTTFQTGAFESMRSCLHTSAVRSTADLMDVIGTSNQCNTFISKNDVPILPLEKLGYFDNFPVPVDVIQEMTHFFLPGSHPGVLHARVGADERWQVFRLFSSDSDFSNVWNSLIADVCNEEIVTVPTQIEFINDAASSVAPLTFPKSYPETTIV